MVRVLLLAWAEPKLGMSQLQLKIFSRTLSCFLLAASLLELQTKVPEDHALVGAFSVITNLRMELFEALISIHYVN